MRFFILALSFAGQCLGQQGALHSIRDSRGTWTLTAETYTSAPHQYILRGQAEMRGADVLLRADEISYDAERGMVQMSGHVRIVTKNNTINAPLATYDVNSGDTIINIGGNSKMLRFH